jgi:two-component system, NarL family, nitrate/nitrite response regulator NarL
LDTVLDLVMTPNNSLGIVIADYPAVVRAGIASLLSAQPDMEVLAAEGSADLVLESLRALRRHTGMLLIVGLGQSGNRGSLWLIRSVREQFPSVSILASAANPDDLTVSQALFTGADGFVNKDADPAAFVDAVRRAGQGEVVLEGVPDAWVGKIADHIEQEAFTEPVLTHREVEVLTVAAEGLTARQIGHRLGVRERTVTTHLGRIYRKLGAPGRVAALAAASESGVLSLARQR